MSHDSIKVAVLVSAGAHPLSGRPRRADQDARAVEMGLALAGERLWVVHAGSRDNPALRGYLGMGVELMDVLDQPEGADVIPALSEHVLRSGAQIILTGTQAETGEGSGLLPYLMAERLGWPMVNGLAQVERIEKGQAWVLQALPRGQRRRLVVRLPFLASVDQAANVARQSAFGPASRGEFRTLQATVEMDALLAESSLQAARPRPKRLKMIKAKTAADRMRAATAKASGGGGQVLRDASAEQAAQALFKLLREEGVLR